MEGAGSSTAMASRSKETSHRRARMTAAALGAAAICCAGATATSHASDSVAAAEIRAVKFEATVEQDLVEVYASVAPIGNPLELGRNLLPREEFRIDYEVTAGASDDETWTSRRQATMGERNYAVLPIGAVRRAHEVGRARYSVVLEDARGRQLDRLTGNLPRRFESRHWYSGIEIPSERDVARSKKKRTLDDAGAGSDSSSQGSDAVPDGALGSERELVPRDAGSDGGGDPLGELDLPGYKPSPVVTATPDDLAGLDFAGGRLSMPVSGSIVGSFGEDRGDHMHAGVDIASPSGTPIHASGDGVVASTGWQGGYGLTVDIAHGDGVTTKYAHQSKISATAGERVRRGDLIGYVGCTGHCYGPHVHFEVRVNGQPTDPVPWLKGR